MGALHSVRTVARRTGAGTMRSPDQGAMEDLALEVVPLRAGEERR